MNFLAHAYLSFNDPGVLAGNMISDFVKGRKQYDLPPAIQKGIRLHRAIDEFTDHHPATREMNKFYHPHYRLYSGAFTDVTYDYFLANDKGEFASDDALKTFSQTVYAMLDEQREMMPERFKKLFPYMKAQDWLYHYREKWLIEKSFHGLERRAVFLNESGRAFDIFNANAEAMQECYNAFFPELKSFALGKFRLLLNH